MTEKADCKDHCHGLPFTAKEYAEYLELYDNGNECDAFCRLSSDEHEKALDIADMLQNDLDDALAEAECMKTKTLDELMVHLDLSLSEWHLPNKFVINVIKSLDRNKSLDKSLFSDLLFTSTSMVVDVISHGLVDNMIEQDGMLDFLNGVASKFYDIDEINNQDGILHIMNAWIDRRSKT